MINHEQAAALRARLLAGQQAEMQQQLSELLESDDMKVLAKRAEAIAKQREASALFDEADRLEAQLATSAEIDRLSAMLPTVNEELNQCVARLDQDREAERVATKRLLGVREAVREAETDEHLGREAGATPDEQIDLLARLNAAKTVEERERVSAGEARDARLNAERTVTVARQVIAAAKSALEDARQRLSAIDETTRASALTMLCDWPQRVHEPDKLTAEEKATAVMAVSMYAGLLGVTQQTVTAAQQNLEEELAKQRLKHIMPAEGHPYRPANPAGQVIAMKPTA